MGVGQLSESDAVDALRLPFYSSRHARGSHVPGNQFDLGNTSLGNLRPPVTYDEQHRNEPTKELNPDTGDQE